jgi:Mitochondrial carrier protein
MIALGGMAGALASLLTTPADVMKTRIMTAAADCAVNPGAILVPSPASLELFFMCCCLFGYLVGCVYFWEGC